MDSKEKAYIPYFDLLRIIATIAVIILHISAQNWELVPVNSFEFKCFNIFNSLTRWSVPIFVMISGSLFLDNDRTIDIKKLYKNNIFRIITAFLFWSLFYAIDKLLTGNSFKTARDSFVTGHYHMWFLYMILGLYIITPLLRKITSDKTATKYFLAVGIFFTFIISRIPVVLKVVGVDITSISSAISSMQFYFAFGYVVYFVLGFYLAKYEISKKARIVLYCLAVIGIIDTIILTDIFSAKMGSAVGDFYSNYSFNTLFAAVGIFLFAKNIRMKINLTKISKYTFGMYLVHPLVLEKLKLWAGIDTLWCNPILSMIIITLVVTVISFIISFAVNHIPKIGKYIS